MIQKFYATLLFVASFAGLSMAQTRTIKDGDLNGGTVYSWSKDTTYLLDGYVYLEDAGILNIEAGTVIKGMTVPSTGDMASALIISRGAQIFAEGTADEPIIFTGEPDDVTNNADLTATDNQTWGGLIILGNAPIGEDIADGEAFPTDVIEGIPSSEVRIQYGGTDPDDNSGVLKYVSIRHGGSILGADNEINGLTMGGVGAGTEIDYIEVFANKDDGIEIFGGTVNVKHALIAFCGDDALDFDESWAGYIQFALTLTSDAQDGLGEHAIEYDGSEAADRTPKVTGRIYNGTFIGAGNPSGNASSRGMRIREDADAQLWNCIFTDMTDYVFRIDDNARGLTLANNIVFNYGGKLEAADKTVAGYSEEDPMLAGISRTVDGGLDPRPNAGSPALSGAALPTEAGIIRTAFRGAFDNNTNWGLGWSALDAYGYFGDLVTPEPTELVMIKDSDINAGESITLTADKEYLLDGYVYVESGATLTIEPGTVIRGKTLPTTGDQTSALIIAAGAQIFAEGTADAPIIMTSEIDDLASTTDLTSTDNQTWGGLIILGNAPIGEDIADGETFPTDVIEGIPSSEVRIKYGGNDPMDNSGIIKYVSIRHGGSVLGADNEINGLTMGGVGAGTEIDYIEIFANKDDGIEFFGGTVNVKHAVLAFCGDDALDFDESWAGNIQFALTLTSDAQDGLGEHAIEYDGSEAADRTPKVTGRIFNGTFIGAGNPSGNASSRGMRIREDADAQLWNCIFTDMTDYVFRVDDNARGLTLANNIINNYGGKLERSDKTLTGYTETDPGIAGISRMPDGGLDPRIDAFGVALEGATFPENDPFAETVSYIGAFSNTDNWALGWTALDAYGYFGDIATKQPKEQETIVDSDINPGDTVTFTADKEYILDGFVYVEETACLIIEPGTVVRGRTIPTNGTDMTSALIIAAGGKIIAEGTSDAPIIMTAEIDDLESTTDLTATDNQTWGGLIILGKAPIGEDIADGETFPTDVIEGIPSSETRIRYGGTDPMDNSGIIKYVSIRHGGSVLGADNEINGLTMGGVGAGTEIDYIEIFANKDDGIEIFGGTVNVKHAVVAFCGDDALDFDESWAGTIQYALTLTSDAQDGLGEHAIEYDGSEAADRTPKTTGRIFNGTFIGAGNPSGNASSRGMRIREDADAQLWNCIFTDMTDYVFRMDDNARGLTLANNIVYNYGGKLEAGDKTITGYIDTIPGIAGISRVPDGGLDPRIDRGGYALYGATYPAGETFADTTGTYIGAFGHTDNWALGWTALDAYGYFGSLVTSTVELGSNDIGVRLDVPNPNPVVQTAQVNFELPGASSVNIAVYDMSGRMLENKSLGRFQKGANQFNLNVVHYQSGLYVMAMTTEFGIVTQRFAVNIQGR